jgi:hypothetical protein
MSYEGMVESLIKAKMIPRTKSKKGRGSKVGYAEFEYRDVDKDIVVVAYYDTNDNFVADLQYTTEEILEMYKLLKEKK